MGIWSWTFAGLAALLLGSGFAFLSGSLLLGAVPAVSVLLVAAYLSWEAHGMNRPPREPKRSGNAGASVYGATSGGAADRGASGGDDCGFGADGGGGFGGDGGGGC